MWVNEYAYDPQKIVVHHQPLTKNHYPASSLPPHPRVHYIGGFNGVASLPAEKYDAFLYTSLFDGMPNTPVEIALRGLPIVAARVGGLPDFIGENGFIVDDITNPKACLLYTSPSPRD